MAVFHPFASRFGASGCFRRLSDGLSSANVVAFRRSTDQSPLAVSPVAHFLSQDSCDSNLDVFLFGLSCRSCRRSEQKVKSLLLFRRRSSQRALFFQSEWSQSSASGGRWRLMGRIPSKVFVPSVQSAQKMKKPSDSKRSFLREEATADGRRDGGGGETLPTCSIPLGGNAGS